MDFSGILRCIIVFELVRVAVTIKADKDVVASDGDVVDCVDIKKQPAFDNPLLKNHKFQELPSELPTAIIAAKKSKWQTLEAHVSVAKCPKGTIPIRRDRVANQTEPKIASSESSDPVHEYAVGIAKAAPKELYGAKGTVSVWDPTVEKEYELSISQIWITNGRYTTNDLNSIEVGWQVSANLYQDNKPRLFIYWTSDTYNATGCYNILRCPGFIQTSNHIVIGGSISPVSTFDGSQYDIIISVWKDQKYGNWWLSLGPNHSLVGYWPAEIFSSLAYAHEVQWGGEIVDSHSFGRHTTTQMGSGRFADEGFRKASYFRNLEIIENNNTFKAVQDIDLKATNRQFYHIEKMFREDWGTCFFYGGPGFDPRYSGVASLVLSSFSSFFSFIIFFII